MTEIFSVKGQMGSRGRAKTLFPCLCLRPRRSAPQRIKNGERFYEKYMSILCINEIFMICPFKGQNELMRNDKISSTNLNFNVYNPSKATKINAGA